MRPTCHEGGPSKFIRPPNQNKWIVGQSLVLAHNGKETAAEAFQGKTCSISVPLTGRLFKRPPSQMKPLSRLTCAPGRILSKPLLQTELDGWCQFPRRTPHVRTSYVMDVKRRLGRGRAARTSEFPAPLGPIVSFSLTLLL